MMLLTGQQKLALFEQEVDVERDWLVAQYAKETAQLGALASAPTFREKILLRMIADLRVQRRWDRAGY